MEEKVEVYNASKNNNKGLIILLIFLVLLVLGLGGYIVYDKVLSSNDEPDIENKDDDTGDISDNRISFEVESGYTEVNLTADQEKEINNKLVAIVNTGTYPLIPYSNRTGNIFEDDCSKVNAAHLYLYNQILGTNKKYDNNGNIVSYYFDIKYPVDNYITGKNESTIVFNTKKVKELASTFFNEEVKCDQTYNGYSFDSETYEQYGAGGGKNYEYLKVVSLYQNGNDYYLILHLATNPHGCANNEFGNTYSCLDVNDDPTAAGIYYKLKYHKDSEKEYIISLTSIDD